jgi:hypothetical protein
MVEVRDDRAGKATVSIDHSTNMRQKSLLILNT